MRVKSLMRAARQLWLPILLVTVCAGAMTLAATSPQPPGSPVVTGTMNGKRLSIPRKYLFFSVEYLGISIWAPNRRKLQEQRKETRISNFTIRIRWPDMAFRNEATEEDFKRSLSTPGDHDWFNVTLQSFAVSDEVKAQGGARSEIPGDYLRRRLNSRIAGDLVVSRHGAPLGTRYRLLGRVDSLSIWRNSGRT